MSSDYIGCVLVLVLALLLESGALDGIGVLVLLALALQYYAASFEKVICTSLLHLTAPVPVGSKDIN